MKYLVTDSRDIRYNLALETYLMEHANLEEPILYFYINSPCIILGRNQNIYEEINRDYVQKHQIIVTRRTSGGGAVFDDLGNVSFSFITKDDGQSNGNFLKFTQPVIEALHEMGAQAAELVGRNDLQIDGKKFSGNAMRLEHGRMFSHGTLMYDVDLDVIEHALNVPKDKIEAKGIKSVHSRVTNLKPYFKEEYQKLTIEQFRDTLAKKILGVADLKDAHPYILDEEVKQEVEKLNAKIFSNWDWVYGKSPKAAIQKRKHFTQGTVDFRLQVNHGKISYCKVYGDFLGQADISAFEQLLLGVRYDRAEIVQTLKEVDVQPYFGKLDKQEIIDLIVTQG
ncbi:lipoate--protein ligase [Ligilactobacillus sp. WILCCON 0076]|uniref:lipoate--protein ligase n=1 Tax=Ligilactobacillus ubinensis TaxID=2876789 RepID=A0A9X2FGW1_9LACO|nr:lipoate--protein ligase [Ligilactobacillus ubinensis]MCP0885740.1 lipoate--protein ligase [Ligilactobacillus ubinensis]